LEAGDFTLTLTLGLQPAIAPNTDIIAGDSFFFILDSFFQSPSHRWIKSCFGAEHAERVIPFSRGELEIPGAPKSNPSPAPKRLSLPNSAVLLPGRFLQKAGPPDPVQLKPLHDKMLQLQIVQPMQHVVVIVSDRNAPAPRSKPIAGQEYETDALYQVAKKFFAQGKLMEARAVFEEARLALKPAPPQLALDIALCALRLGDTNQALQWLGVAIEDGYEKKSLQSAEELASLHELPEFQKLFIESKREYHFVALHPGDTLQIERFQATNLLVGALVGGEPWESSVSL
jgi:hypothetical protein